MVRRLEKPVFMRMVLLAAIGVPAATVLGGALPSSPSKELWAGHQVVFGKTSVPMMGEKETRSESFVLAEVTRNSNTITLEQIACKVRFKEIAGVGVRIPTAALLKLPRARIRFGMTPKGIGRATPWRVGWQQEDIDRDGAPGLSIAVDASVCSGTLHVASDTTSRAVGRLTEDGMLGKIEVDVKQRILGSDSLCLRLFSKDTEESQTGAFVYRRVSNDSTCASLLRNPWPIKASVKRK